MNAERPLVLLSPDDDGYDDARTVFNTRLTGRPALIAKCITVDDVKAAIALSRERGLPVTVKGGGHSGAGWSSITDGLVIDLTGMRDVQVDETSRTAWVGGGTRAMDLISAAAPHGLAPVTGVSPKVGLGGLLLGLGEGYLTPRHGFGTDNVLEVQMVTAEGDVVTASAAANPELFWAIRGAGANFGVVTALKLKLHPAPANTVGGWITFGPDAVPAVARHIWEVMRDGSRDYFPLAIFELDESGDPQVKIIPGHTGSRADAAHDLARLRECATPVADETAEMTYVDLINEIGGPDEDEEASRRLAWDVYRFPFDGEADRQQQVLLGLQQDLSPSAHFNLWRTVPIEPPSPAGAAPRLPGITVFLSTRWDDASEDGRELHWIEGTATALIRAGVVESAANTVNHVSTIDDFRIRALFGPETYGRLVAVKAIYDPGNVFRRNCNIPSSTSSSLG